MVCGNCGKAVQQNDKFCTYCSYKIEKNETRAPPSIPTLSEDRVESTTSVEALQYNKKGDDLFDAGNYEDSLVYFDKAIELEPTNGEFWKNKGVSLTKQNKIDEAQECFDKAIELGSKKEVERFLTILQMTRDVEAMTETINQNIETIQNVTEEIAQARTSAQTASETLRNVNEKLESENEKFEYENEAQLKDDKEYNYYEILGVPINASLEEIKKRFRELSLKFHPDKETSSLSQQTMKQIIEAYNTLKDSKKRKEYDDTL